MKIVPSDCYDISRASDYSKSANVSIVWGFPDQFTGVLSF